jgi:large subunit ribosomal protein L33
MALKGANQIITLQCTECKEKNYVTTKNKKKHAEKLELKKYCPRERRHTLHREVK